MNCNRGFRVGLLLHQFFSDRRKQCYFFVNTERMFQISDLKKLIVEKFNIPCHVQLMQNQFLLLDEDSVLVLRQDDIIEVVKAEENQRKKNSTTKRLHDEVQNYENYQTALSESETEEPAFLPKKKKKSHGSSRRSSTVESSCFIPEVIHNDSFNHQKKCKRRKEKNSHHEVTDLKNLDNENASNLSAHFFNESLEKNYGKKKKNKNKDDNEKNDWVDENCKDLKKSELKSSTPRNIDNSAVKPEMTFDPSLATTVSNKVASSLLNAITSVSNCDYEYSSPNSRHTEHISSSAKKKIKNEQARLKYSGLAETLKQIQTSGNSTVNDKDESLVQNGSLLDPQIEIPVKKRKRVRKHRKKNKHNVEDKQSTSEKVRQIVFKPTSINSSLNCSARTHKRFDSESDNEEEEAGDVSKTDAKMEVAEELNPNLKLCSQISPLTPPSEHNSEDDVYKKLMDLKKQNDPVIFERKRTLEKNDLISEVDKASDSNEPNPAPRQDIKPEESLPSCVDSVSNLSLPLDQGDEKNRSKPLQNFLGSYVRKNNIMSNTEKEIYGEDSSVISDCPAQFRKNICDINLEIIDIDNYPVIESTRQNDILVFKTLKISSDFTPTISSLILARVLKVGEENEIQLEILSGKEEFEQMKDKPLDEDMGVSDTFMSLKWCDLIEPRLMYP